MVKAPPHFYTIVLGNIVAGIIVTIVAQWYYDRKGNQNG